VAARFTPPMTAAMPLDRLAATWDALIAQAGPFAAVKTVRVQDVNGLRVAFVMCAFEKTDLQIRMAFDAQLRVAGFGVMPAPSTVSWVAPAYVNPGAFEEREVTIGDRFTLPGTLSIPNGTGPFPAVVLVHGSGPNDRDETIGPNKPFKDLALGLASRGIAVLRYDKRTLAAPGSFAPPARYTVKEEVLDDVRSAVSLLAATPRIDARRIYIVGHSLGAMLAPRIAAEDRRVAGIAILAGPTRPIEELTIDQVKYLAGTNAPQVAAAEESARAIRSPQLTASGTVTFLGVSTPGSYWLDLRDYHPADVAAALTIPLLVLQGERDYQVPLIELEGWRKALAGHANATLKSYPALNHLFLEGTGPSRPEEYLQPGHVPAFVVRDLDEWLRANGNTIR
jgi:dienelactone hydrolase